MCKLFNEHRIWERSQAGELKFRIDSKPKSENFTDHNGLVCTTNELLTVWDDRFEAGDIRREVAARVHRHVTDDGVPGGSGKWDPSKGELYIDGRRYRRFKTTDGRPPVCELCEGGDLIPAQERFFDSTYRPE